MLRKLIMLALLAAIGLGFGLRAAQRHSQAAPALSPQLGNPPGMIPMPGPTLGPGPSALPVTNPTQGPAKTQPAPTPPAAAPTVMPPFARPYDPYASPPGQPGAKWGYPGANGGDDGEGSPPPDQPDPTPENPVRKIYENGKIMVMVGSERHFGYRIGDIVPVTILVAVDDSVHVNFDYIAKGVLGADGSDFELAQPATIKPVAKDKGRTLYRMDLQLRSWVVKKAIVFNADFLYALELTPDGKTPNWKRLTTPDFVVTTSNTADNGTDLLEGPTDESSPRLSWFTYPLLLIGSTLVLIWPALLFLSWLRRVRPPQNLPANELAWLSFDRAIAEGKASGLSPRHYKRIAFALRRYLGVQAATLEEVSEQLKDHPDLEAVKSALSKCEAVIYGRQTLTPEENAELIAELEKLVPRP